MLSSLQQLIITRGLTDALEIGAINKSDAKELNDGFAGVCAATRSGTQRALEGFCEKADAAVKPQKDRQFLTPSMILCNTRLALRAASALESDYKHKRSPRPPDAIAKILGVSIEEIRQAAAFIFVDPRPDYYSQLSAALDPDKKRPKKGKTKLPHNPIISEAIESAVCTGRLPGAPLRRRVEQALLSDLDSIVRRFDEKGFSVNEVAFSRYSHYFREYGIRAYYLFFGESLDALYRFFSGYPKATQESIMDIFDPKSHINECEYVTRATRARRIRNAAMRWCRVTDDLLFGLDRATDKKDAIELIESHFGVHLGARIRRDFRMESAKTILRFWKRHNICFIPNVLCFIYQLETLQEKLADYERLLPEIDSMALPFKTRTRLLNLKMPPEELRRRVAFFEARGLPHEYFVPYLTVIGKADTFRDHTAKRIRGTICAETRMSQVKSRVQSKVHSEKINIADPNRWAALHWLHGSGSPYHTISTPGQHCTPELVAHHSRLFSEAGAEVSKLRLLLLGPKTIMPIRESIAEEQNTRKIEESRYEELMEKRGFSRVPKFLPQQWVIRNVRKYRMARRIEDAEAQAGFDLFTPENVERGYAVWHWLQLEQPSQGKRIAALKRRLNQEEFGRELETLYDFKRDNLTSTAQQIPPGQLWQYLRILESADITPQDVSINQNSLHAARLQAYCFLTSRGEEITHCQRLYLKRYELADSAMERWRWRDAHELFVFADDRELRTLGRLLNAKRPNTGAALLWRRILQKRAEEHTAAIQELLLTTASFARMNALLAKFTPAQLLERFKVFERLKKPVDTNLLFLEPKAIRESLAA